MQIIETNIKALYELSSRYKSTFLTNHIFYKPSQCACYFEVDNDDDDVKYLKQYKHKISVQHFKQFHYHRRINSNSIADKSAISHT